MTRLALSDDYIIHLETENARLEAALVKAAAWVPTHTEGGADLHREILAVLTNEETTPCSITS